MRFEPDGHAAFGHAGEEAVGFVLDLGEDGVDEEGLDAFASESHAQFFVDGLFLPDAVEFAGLPGDLAFQVFQSMEAALEPALLGEESLLAGLQVGYEGGEAGEAGSGFGEASLVRLEVGEGILHLRETVSAFAEGLPSLSQRILLLG